LLYYQAFLLVPQTEDRAVSDLVLNVVNGGAVPNEQVKEYVKKGFDVKTLVVDKCPTNALEWDAKAKKLKLIPKDCVRCMHCINKMPKALRPGKDKGATILIGGKAPIIKGAMLSWVIVPFMKVATTIGKGVINPDVISMHLIAAGVVAAITWNLLTWWWGIPSSSSHTLVGGLIGAAVAGSGFSSVVYSGVIKIAIFIVVAPATSISINLSPDKSETALSPPKKWVSPRISKSGMNLLL
jgi:NAD-dependent dihydropyrimidine dehydrogenase PreA subunit